MIIMTMMKGMGEGGERERKREDASRPVQIKIRAENHDLTKHKT